MKIFVGADHAGFKLKERLVPFLKKLGHEVKDMGAFEYNENDDYPDFMLPIANEVSQNPKEVRAILVGGSGQGEAMVANRFKNVRATVWYGGNEEILKLSREHNDANILSIGARFVEVENALKNVEVWLDIPFTNQERHERRIKKIDNQ
ncbi:MAG: ribose-5-phosphate isomerase [Candidatus Zambryskibacteria bacterium CG22_combo_CG10-13_8_21_14_all_42_17]|uniref:Ribose-5-phosphate isomerase n=1 Tax=Candidatus Zambryskibacteria bacterium CG22_combo_CG10-13_8_21_14_all_42_17 TaxID=1975118 RepID=A0A2H0BDS7_9BACT|nr:MAG: ribose-5-phosphate isomerase [Candidatus Zambryskibacteria bacterium CG22_combo_CG10-13_8_21_14_all_42_17]